MSTVPTVGVRFWEPVVERYRERNLRRYFRGDAAFAAPDIYEFLESEGFLYAIRLPKNQILQESIAHLLTRPVGRPPNHVRRYYAGFRYQAGSWDRKRRVVLVPTVNLPFVPTQNCSLFGLSMTAHRVAMLALPTERERCADVRMGDQDVVEALLGAGRLEGGAVAAVRGEPSNDPLLDRDGPTGPGSVGRCERVCAASASGAQAGPLQGDHRRAP